MTEPIPIDDPSDPRLADYLGLRDPEGRRRKEAAEGIFVAEGITVLSRLLGSAYRVRSVLVLPSRHPRLAPLLDPLAVPVYVAPREILTAVAGFDLHRGVVAIAERGTAPTLDAVLATARTVVVLEGLNDPENLGAIARSARALGADALVLDDTCADPFARRTVRVSMGEVLYLPVVRCSDWPATLTALAAAGFQVAALTPAPTAISIHEWMPPARVALVLGAEGPGLGRATIAAASVALRIPIHPDVDSLNVGHAAAVALATLAARRT